MPNKITDIFCDYLNGYCSTKIWNNPQLEYRHNIKLILQESRPRKSTWQRTGELVTLPDETNQYFVYETPSDYFGLDVGSTDWQTVSTLLMGGTLVDGTTSVERSNIQLRFHDSTGKRLMSNMVFMKTSTVSSNTTLIAINATMLAKISDSDDAENDLYIGVYYDSDTPNDIDIVNYKVDSYNIDAVVAAGQTANIKFINGYAVRSFTKTDLEAGDYVELVTDENVSFTFQIDLADDDMARMYTSTDGQSKYIIHIPKAQNPDNALISHDTCDFYVYPRNASNKNLRGRFFHRCQGSEKYSFIQLTHNDFGVPTALVDQFAGYCDSNEIVIDVVVRRHAHNLTLQRDRNYIDYLYQLSDNTIMDFLEGNASVSMPFWSAKTLEGSNFTAILKDTSNALLTYDLNKYTEALGYINTAHLLCNRVRRFVGGSKTATSLTQVITLPLAYQYKTCPTCGYVSTILDDVCGECNTDISNHLQLGAIVSFNGVKVPFENVDILVRAGIASDDNPEAIKMVVTVNHLDEMADRRDSNELTVEIIEKREFDSYRLSIPIYYKWEAEDGSIIYTSVMNPTSSSKLYSDSSLTNQLSSAVTASTRNVPATITVDSKVYTRYEKRTFYLRKGSYNFYKIDTLATPVQIPNGTLDTTYTKIDEDMYSVETLGVITKVTFSNDYSSAEILAQSQEGSYIQSKSIQDLLDAAQALTYIPSDQAQIPVYYTFTPTTGSMAFETSACDDIEVYELSDGKYSYSTATSGAFDVDDIGVSKKRITFAESMADKTFMIVVYALTDVPVMNDKELHLYLNGLHLVENVDFWKVNPGSNLPKVYTLHNISYLKETNNYLEVFESDMEDVVDGSNFICCDYINSKKNPLLFYTEFTTAYIGGYQHQSLVWTSGRLSTNSEIYSRKSGKTHFAWKCDTEVVYTLSSTPAIGDTVYTDLDNIEVAGKVASNDSSLIVVGEKTYFRYTAGDWNYTLTDTNRGALYDVKTIIPPQVRSAMSESYLSADLERFGKIVDYFNTLTSDDPERYTMPYSHHIASIYLNAIVDDLVDGTITIPANTDIDYILPYISGTAATKQGKTAYLKKDYDYLKKFDLALATTEEYVKNIDGTNSSVKKTVPLVSRKFCDIFPSYTQRLTPDSSMYRTLLSIINYFVPEDTVVDIEGVDTTVENNRS